MGKLNTCPNCGAAMVRDVCDYCGSRVLDLTGIDVDSGKPFWLRFHHDKKITKIKVTLGGLNMTVEPQVSCLVDWNGMYHPVRGNNVYRTINLELYGVPWEDVITEEV